MVEDTGIGILHAAPVVIAMAVVGAMLWWVATSESPEEVSLQSAVSQLEDPGAALIPDVESGTEDATGQSAGAGGVPDTTEGSGVAAEPADGSTEDAATTDANNTGTESESPVLTDITGVWNLDTSIGDYDYEQATGSFAGFRVDEVLTLGERTAVGRTGEVSGTITITDDTLTNAEVIVETNTMGTDWSIRDRKMHLALKTDRFQQAIFKLVEPVPLPEGTGAGEEFTVQAHGDLTIAGISSKSVFNLQAQLVDDILVIIGSGEVTFADHDIKTPTAPIVLSVEDHGIVEFQLLFTR